MKKFQCIRNVPEFQLEAAGALLVQDAVLIALLDECQACAPGDGADTVGIAVKVCFNDIARIKESSVGTQAGSCFIFRAVNNHLLPCIGSGGYLVVVNSLRTCHVASDPAAVGNALGEE